MRAKPEEIVSVLREEIQNYDTRVRRDETGTVLEVGDGIATVYGLDQAVYGELVELDTGVKGMVMNLARDSVGVVLLGSEAVGGAPHWGHRGPVIWRVAGRRRPPWATA